MNKKSKRAEITECQTGRVEYFSFRKIKLVDKFLIIAMAILFLESLFSVFTISDYHALLEKIDVVIHTAMASIFGYFISVNFIRPEFETVKPNANMSENEPKLPVIPSADVADNKNAHHGETITTGAPQTNETNNTLRDRRSPGRQTSSSKLQIFVVGMLFISSVLALILIKYFAADNDYSMARLFQFRDIVSGCVGFLIGIPSEHKQR